MELSNNSNKIKKIVNLIESETPKIQGEAYLRISPFDDYFMFTVNSLLETNNVPVDLTGMGTFYLSFFGTNQEIKIPNFTNIKDIDSSKGQIVFRINKEDSKRILSLSNNIFYISNRIESDTQFSDESVLYTGKFIKFNEFPDTVLSEKLKKLKEQKNSEILELKSQIQQLEDQILNFETNNTNLNNLLQIEIAKNNNLTDALNSVKNGLSKRIQSKIDTITEQNISKIKDSTTITGKSVAGLENTSSILNEESSKPIKRE